MKNIDLYIKEAHISYKEYKSKIRLNSDLAYKEKKFWDNMIDSQDFNNKTDEIDIDSWKNNNQDVLKKYKISDEDLETILQYEIQQGLMSTEDEIMYKVII